MIKISYLIPIYNRVSFLKFLCSGLESQYGNFDREYIFVDDGSTDDTFTQLKFMTSRWDNVTIIQQRNYGPSIALNRALAEARGTYVKPLDSDDMLLPWASDYLLMAAEQTGAEFVTGLRQDQLHYNSDQDLAQLVTPAHSKGAGQIWDMLPHSIRNSQTQPTLWMARRDAIQSIGGSDEGVFIQDYSIELKMAARGNVAVIPGAIARIGHDAGQLSNNEAQTLHDCNAALVRFLAQNPHIPSKLRRLALKRTAGRAWLWALRKGGAQPFSATHRLKLRADLGILSLTPKSAAQMCEPFSATNTIRVPMKCP